MIQVGIYIQNAETLVYDRVDLFGDEKISVVSSIQNVNDISKTFTDYSQTFSVPASKTNNKIFKHWYENSRVNPFSTLARANGRIDVDGFFFRSGKIQLESCEIESGQPKNYSINFIGALANLKDIFSGKFLKDLDTSEYDLLYSPAIVLQKVTSNTPTSPISPDVAFPLITSNRFWTYGTGTNWNLAQNNHPIYYDDLFPSLSLRAMFLLIESNYGVDFSGAFLADKRFMNAHLLLKNSEKYISKRQIKIVDFDSVPSSVDTGFKIDVNTNVLTILEVPQTRRIGSINYEYSVRQFNASITPLTSGVVFTLQLYDAGNLVWESEERTSVANVPSSYPEMRFEDRGSYDYEYTFGVASYINGFQFTAQTRRTSDNIDTGTWAAYVRLDTITFIYYYFQATGSTMTFPAYTLQLSQYMPDMKVEDFFTGILKMFNLTCYSTDGQNWNIDTIDNYYNNGVDRDFTQYVKADKKTINRVKTYKKVNFDYEKSESIINNLYLSNAGIPYGSLYYSTTPPADGENYSIKLPFENLNFSNLSDKLQVGYCLKSDYNSYIPKPIILYDYNPTSVTTLNNGTHFHFAQTPSAGNGNGSSYTTYKAFGQEFIDTTVSPNITYGLNFNEQQSTLTNELVTKGLYDQYYSNYFANIYDFKARLIKVSAILPTSVLVSLKLNDTIFIRGDKFIINTLTMDLTTGETQLELLSDQRI